MTLTTSSFAHWIRRPVCRRRSLTKRQSSNFSARRKSVILRLPVEALAAGTPDTSRGAARSVFTEGMARSGMAIKIQATGNATTTIYHNVKKMRACMHMMKVILEAGGAALYSQHAGQSQRLIMRHALIDRHDILMRSFQEWTAAEYDTRVTQRTLRLELHQSMDARTWMPRNEVKKRFTADVQQPLQVWGIYRLHRSIVFVQQPFQVWGLISINDFVLSHSWTSSVTCWSPFRPSMDGRNCKKRLRFAGIDSKSQIRIFLWRQKFSSPTRIQVYNI